MAPPSKQALVRALLDRHGRTYAEELGIDVRKETPTELFKLLVASMLMSARISSDIAAEAARGLFDAGWTSPGKLAEASWDERVEVLNRAGYARYQERTSTMLGDLSEHLEQRWHGDLRRLREEAGRDPEQERGLIKEVKGVGDVGADIFFREAQVAWDELRPFADARALAAAKKLDLGADVDALRRHLEGDGDGDGDGEFARLVAALVRCELDDDYDGVREQAASE